MNFIYTIIIAIYIFTKRNFIHKVNFAYKLNGLDTCTGVFGIPVIARPTHSS